MKFKLEVCFPIESKLKILSEQTTSCEQPTNQNNCSSEVKLEDFLKQALLPPDFTDGDLVCAMEVLGKSAIRSVKSLKRLAYSSSEMTRVLKSEVGLTQLGIVNAIVDALFETTSTNTQ